MKICFITTIHQSIDWFVADAAKYFSVHGYDVSYICNMRGVLFRYIGYSGRSDLILYNMLLPMPHSFHQSQQSWPALNSGCMHSGGCDMKAFPVLNARCSWRQKSSPAPCLHMSASSAIRICRL